MRSDVPLGAALSGGINTSAVVCAMRAVEPDMPIHTFSHVAASASLSEERWIDMINTRTGAISHKVKPMAKTFARDLDSLILSQGEPFGSTSIYAQYRVFQLAKERGVTVVLEGQGADELLAGYWGYPGQRILSLMEEGRFVAANSFARNWAKWPGRTYSRAWMYFGHLQMSDGILRFARRRLGRSFAPEWLKMDMLKDLGVELRESRQELTKTGRARRVVERLIWEAQSRVLPGLLRHGDRNAMHLSIEGRVPFLTIPLAELLFSLPEHYLIGNNGETKSVFRHAMRGIVPDPILDRRDKIGFATPERDWLMQIAPLARK